MRTGRVLEQGSANVLKKTRGQTEEKMGTVTGKVPTTCSVEEEEDINFF